MNRLACSLAVALLTLLSLVPCARAMPVRVRGGAQIQAQARFADGALELQALLSDDGRAAIPDSFLTLSGKGLELGAAAACPGQTARIVRPEPGGASLKAMTDAAGELCLRWSEPPASGRLALRFDGDSYHAAAELALKFDQAASQKLATRLRFDPRPLWIDLDRPEIALSALLELGSRTTFAERGGLRVTLHDESGRELATADSSGDGKLRFTTKSERFGGPGGGTLELRFAGNGELADARDQQAITRRAEARLELGGEPEPTARGELATLRLRIASVRGPVDGGVVEALHGDASIASAPVVQGAAELSVALPEQGEEPTVALSLRYLPASPWYRPGAPLSVAVPVAPPSLLWRVVLTSVVLAAAAWVTLSWRRARTLPTPPEEVLVLEPGVHIVESRRDAKGYSGVVVDAHDGAPIGGVDIAVRAPALNGEHVLLRVVSDERGAFAFELEERPHGAELVASSATHSAERKALPGGGRLRIALVTRRRALLARLVQWARIRGTPFDARPEATPGHVRAVARGKPAIESWANAVEAAAFGPEEVDERLEEKVADKEPGPLER